MNAEFFQIDLNVERHAKRDHVKMHTEMNTEMHTELNTKLNTSWIWSWIWSKWDCKWDCKWRRVRREMNLRKSHERRRRWWLRINLLVFFSRQRDQILFHIEEKNFEINAQYFIIKNLISAYEIMWDECVMLINIEISSTISSEIVSEWWFWNNQKEEEHFFENVNSMY
jgi:hypothetical protein